MEKWIPTLMTALIVLSFISIRMLPATAESNIGVPVTIILSGAFEEGNLTNGVIKVTSGFVIIGGQDNVVCNCIPPGYNNPDLDCIYISSSQQTNINAATITLGGIQGRIMRLAGLATSINDTLLSVVFGVGPPFPGSTEITEGVNGPVDFLINAEGSIKGNATSVSLTATGVVTEGPTVSLQTCPCKTVVAKGYNLPINLTIMNTGYLDQIPYINVYMDTTIIGTEQNITLTYETPTTLTLTCNTTGLNMGKHNITVSLTDNANPIAIVLTAPGDLNGDYNVSLTDLVLLASAYGSHPSETKWNPNADINGNGAVDLADLVLLASHYGQKISPAD